MQNISTPNASSGGQRQTHCAPLLRTEEAKLHELGSVSEGPAGEVATWLPVEFTLAVVRVDATVLEHLYGPRDNHRAAHLAIATKQVRPANLPVPPVGFNASH